MQASCTIFASQVQLFLRKAACRADSLLYSTKAIPLLVLCPPSHHDAEDFSAKRFVYKCQPRGDTTKNVIEVTHLLQEQYKKLKEYYEDKNIHLKNYVKGSIQSEFQFKTSESKMKAEANLLKKRAEIDQKSVYDKHNQFIKICDLDELRKEIEQKIGKLTLQERELLEQGEEIAQQQRAFKKFENDIEEWRKKYNKWLDSMDGRYTEGTKAEREINNELLKISENNYTYNDTIKNIIAIDKVRHGKERELNERSDKDFDVAMERLKSDNEKHYDEAKNYYENELPSNPKVAHLRKLLSTYEEACLHLTEDLSKSEVQDHSIEQHETTSDVDSKEGDSQTQVTSPASSLEEIQSNNEEIQSDNSEPFVLQDFIDKLAGELMNPEINIKGEESFTEMQERHLAYHLNQLGELEQVEEEQVEEKILWTDAGREIRLFHRTELPITLAQEAEALGAARKLFGGDDKIHQIGCAHPKSNCHGETFADGIDHIYNEDVITILQDNGYKIIQKSSDQVQIDLSTSTGLKPQKGDVIVYLGRESLSDTDQNEVSITHSGRLSEIKDDKISFISKWGSYGTYECNIEDYTKLGANTEEGWALVRPPSKISRKVGKVIRQFVGDLIEPIQLEGLEPK